MFGIYLASKEAMYRPDKGLMTAKVFGEASGDQIGAHGTGKFCNLTALRLEDGLEVVVGTMPVRELSGVSLPPRASDEFIFNQSDFKNREPVEDLVLIPSGNDGYVAGFVMDRSDRTEGDRPYGNLLQNFREFVHR